MSHMCSVDREIVTIQIPYTFLYFLSSFWNHLHLMHFTTCYLGGNLLIQTFFDCDKNSGSNLYKNNPSILPQEETTRSMTLYNLIFNTKVDDICPYSNPSRYYKNNFKNAFLNNYFTISAAQTETFNFKHFLNLFNSFSLPTIYTRNINRYR